MRLENTKFLKYVGLVFRNAVYNEDTLNPSDLDYLCYLDAFEWFTTKQLKEGLLACRWDIKRFQRLQRDGWIKKTDYKPNTRIGEHNKYTLTTRGKLLVRKLEKQLLGLEKISESPYSNKIFKDKRKIDKHYAEAIKLFNRDKSR